MSNRFQCTAVGLLAYIGAQVTDPPLAGLPMLSGAALFFLAAVFDLKIFEERSAKRAKDA